jgi:hypothetical protein
MMVRNIVILSGAGTARSEVLAESKDLVFADSAGGPLRNSHDAVVTRSTGRRENALRRQDRDCRE